MSNKSVIKFLVGLAAVIFCIIILQLWTFGARQEKLSQYWQTLYYTSELSRLYQQALFLEQQLLDVPITKKSTIKIIQKEIQDTYHQIELLDKIRREHK